MKKITLEISSTIDDQGAKKITEALNDLSGIVAADAVPPEGRAYAYAGDMLEEYAASGAVRNAGYECRVIKEEYLNNVEDYKQSLTPPAFNVQQ